MVFREILLNVKKLHSLSIIHFDLKCINILLDPLPTYDEPSFWVPPTEAPGFKIILADFGEAKCYGGRDSAVTVRTRWVHNLLKYMLPSTDLPRGHMVFVVALTDF